jgi:hypothetical protein
LFSTEKEGKSKKNLIKRLKTAEKKYFDQLQGAYAPWSWSKYTPEVDEGKKTMFNGLLENVQKNSSLSNSQ